MINEIIGNDKHTVINLIEKILETKSILLLVAYNALKIIKLQ